MTAFLANVVRDDKKHPDPYTTSDFQIDWEDVWKAVGSPQEEPEPTEEEVVAKNVALFDKVMALNTWFGGVAK